MNNEKIILQLLLILIPEDNEHCTSVFLHSNAIYKIEISSSLFPHAKIKLNLYGISKIMNFL
jgi:hypothetical protein